MREYNFSRTELANILKWASEKHPDLYERYLGGDEIIIENSTISESKGIKEVYSHSNLSSSYKADLDRAEAKSILIQYPFGIIEHPNCEQNDFIFINKDGEFYFFHTSREEVSTYDWDSDSDEIEGVDDQSVSGEHANAYAYCPGQDFEMCFSGEGVEWFDRLRNMDDPTCYNKNQSAKKKMANKL